MVENILTRDPRIAELLEHRGKLGPDGAQTRLAVMAEKARCHVDDIERLRSELSTATREAEDLETQLANGEAFKGEGSEHKNVLIDQMIDVRAQAALSSSFGVSAGLRSQYHEKRARIEEYERDAAEEATRIEMVRLVARDKAREVKQVRESISRRLAVLDSLLEGAETAAPNASGGGASPMVDSRRLAVAPPVGHGRRSTRHVIRRIRRRR